MSTEEKVCVTIVTGLCAGRSVPEIVKFHKLKKSTLRDVKRCYDAFIAAEGLPEDFSSDRKIHKKRSNSPGGDIVARLQELVDQGPSRSMRSLARELNISKFVVKKKMAAGYPLQVLCFEKGPVYETGNEGEEAGEGEAAA